MSSSLTVHHLRISQSERIVWLCEELGIPYSLKTYDRDPLLAPDSLRAVHWTGTAPVLEDGDIKLGESGAIVEYLLSKYGNGRLAVPPSHADYPDYLFWLHHANSSLQPATMSLMGARASKSGGGLAGSLMQKRFENSLAAMDKRLGVSAYLGGNEVSAADVMTVFSLTTMRLFVPFSLAEYPNVVAYLQRIGQREPYRRAMQKGDPGMEPVLSGMPPERSLL